VRSPTLLAILGLLVGAPPVQADSHEPHIRHGHALSTVQLATLAKGAQTFDGLGSHQRAVSTHSAEAQKFFDQGLRLTYAFNHDEAARSFAKAAELDPTCAACFWGVALTLGPNYNVPMLPGRAQATWDALQKARGVAKGASRVELALIAALEKRYPGPAPLDPPAQQPHTEAYAKAMREVAQKFPDDLDVQVLFAESLMDVTPWKLWTLDGKPGPATEEIVRTLERVLSQSPEHPGANHYYIHAVEASRHPERAEPAADRLARLMPGAGHVVHMPAHIYQRVGRYADASQANRKAAEVDLAYLARTDPPGYYAMYLGHNYGFLAYSATMEGRAQEALEASRRSAQAVPPELLEMMPGMDFFASEPLLVGVRFGRWEELLKEPKPPEKYATLTALWLHAQGMAHASLGRLAEARQDLKALETLRAKMPADLIVSNNLGRDIVDVAAGAVKARIAEKEGKTDGALAAWKDAVQREDKLSYSEPADWFYPLRHFWGAALLDAKHFAEAEKVFREDLLRNPKNGYALYGLWQALAGLAKPEAKQAEADFRRAWSRADFKLVRSAP
jgi:tetratricopeptide (TPR) repeat protein